MQSTTSLQALFDSYLSASEQQANKKLALISSAIEYQRKKRGMTQRDFAEFMDVKQPMISKWESGEYNFTVQALSYISKKLAISVDSLFLGDPDIRVSLFSPASEPSQVSYAFYSRANEQLTTSSMAAAVNTSFHEILPCQIASVLKGNDVA